MNGAYGFNNQLFNEDVITSDLYDDHIVQYNHMNKDAPAIILNHIIPLMLQVRCLL